MSDTFSLMPRAAARVDDGPHRLAQAEGRLAGDLTAGAVRTWLEGAGDRIALMWPQGFSAQVRPLQILDDRGRVVAAEGQWLIVAGGFLEDTLSQPPGSEPVFALWTVAVA